MNEQQPSQVLLHWNHVRSQPVPVVPVERPIMGPDNLFSDHVPVPEPDLTVPDEFSDITLVVEGRKLYTSKAILAAVSPVWRAMFTSDFKEKEAKEIPLPDKTFDDIKEMLLCIQPSFMKQVTAENVFRILPLVHEYQMQKLAKECKEQLWQLLKNYGKGVTIDGIIRIVVMSQNYGIKDVLENGVGIVARQRLSEIENNPEYKNLEAETIIAIYRKRIISLEPEAPNPPRQRIPACGGFTFPQTAHGTGAFSFGPR